MALPVPNPTAQEGADKICPPAGGMRDTAFVALIAAALLAMPFGFLPAAIPLGLAILVGWERWGATPQPAAIWFLAFIAVEVAVSPWVPSPQRHLSSLTGAYVVWFVVWRQVAATPLSATLVRRLSQAVAGCGILITAIGLAARLGLRGRWMAIAWPWPAGTHLFDLELSDQFGPVAAGFSMNPNVVAALLVLIWPITLTLGLDAKGWRRWTWFGATLAQWAVLFLTASRGAVLAWCAVAAIWAWRDSRLRRPLLAMTGALAVVVAVSLPLWLPAAYKVPSILDRHLSSNTVRFSLLHSGLEMIQDRPLTGFGVDGFTDGYPRYRYPEDTYNCPHLHDWYLQVAVESGLPGAMLLFAGVGSMMRRARREGHAAAESTLGFVVYSLNDYLFHDPRVALVAWIIWGLGCRSRRDDCGKPPAT